jgi:hypothetical protein
VSDGAGAQYKNRKNLANLLHHEEDFGIYAEWHFTATSHGKLTCDAMSGVVKRCTRLHSMKNKDIITTPKLMYDIVAPLLPNLRFVWVSKADVQSVQAELEKRYEEIKTIPGTRKCHGFIPDGPNRLKIKKYSLSEDFVSYISDIRVEARDTEAIQEDEEGPKWETGDFIVVKLARSYQVGVVWEEVEYGEVRVQMMRKTRIKGHFEWPEPEKMDFIPVRDILLVISKPTTKNGKTYTISTDDQNRISEIFLQPFVTH